MGHLIGQIAFTHQGLLLPVQQGVDGDDHGGQLTRHSLIRDTLVLTQVQPLHALRELIQRPQPPAHGHAQRHHDDGQQPEARLNHLHGDVIGQAIALGQRNHDRDLGFFVVAPLGKTAP